MSTPATEATYQNARKYHYTPSKTPDGKSMSDEQRYAKAEELYKLAADAGHPFAQNALASFFQEYIKSNISEPCKSELKNYKEYCQNIMKYYTLAANQETNKDAAAEAQFALGYMYMNGDDGVSKDIDEAKRFLHMAVKNNHPSAQTLLDRLEKMSAGTRKTKVSKTKYRKHSHIRSRNRRRIVKSKSESKSKSKTKRRQKK